MPGVFLMTPQWGAFGKMPALGDFFRLGVAADFVAAWDPWLQALLVAGRGALGAGWGAAYMTAPLWRFALAPGVAGAGGVAGVLMPSVDRVGRQFPLTLACPVAGAPLELLTAAPGVWARAEDLALECLEDGMTREGLEARLAGLEAWALAPGQRLDLGGVTLARGQGLTGALAALQPRPALAGFACDRGGEAMVILAQTLPGDEVAPVFFAPVPEAGGGGA